MISPIANIAGTLNLGGNNLYGELPSEIGQWTNLGKGATGFLFARLVMTMLSPTHSRVMLH